MYPRALSRRLAGEVGSSTPLRRTGIAIPTCPGDNQGLGAGHKLFTAAVRMIAASVDAKPNLRSLPSTNEGDTSFRRSRQSSCRY